MFEIVQNIIILLCSSSALLVLLSKNPIQSLLSLIFTFALSSVLFFVLGVEFVSLLIFVVYIGAIAVLFLFVIMMLNIKIVELRTLYLRYLPVGIFLVLFFLFELYFFLCVEFFSYNFEFLFINWVNFIDFKGNIYLISSIIYSYYCILFILLGLILFIAMLGSIVLLVNWMDSKNLSVKTYYYESYGKNRVENLFIKTDNWK